MAPKVKDELEILREQEKNDKRFAPVKIKVPGGVISGKWWGPKNVRPILGFHGWMDNCGTFDKLIPLLPPEYAFLVVDLPGHGQSFHFPPGMTYSYYDMSILIERIRKAYQWDVVSFMGHSMGAHCGFIYASMFPDKVDLFLALEAFEPCLLKPVAWMKSNLVEFVRNEESEESKQAKVEPPAYTYEELVDRTVKRSFHSVPAEAAKYIITRQVQKSKKYPGKYFFTFDRRLRGFDRASRHLDDVIAFGANITCPVLYLISDDSYVKSIIYKKNQKFRDFMQEINPNFHIRYGPGTHHFPLSHPEAYVGYIAWFLGEYKPIKITAKL